MLLTPVGWARLPDEATVRRSADAMAGCPMNGLPATYDLGVNQTPHRQLADWVQARSSENRRGPSSGISSWRQARRFAFRSTTRCPGSGPRSPHTKPKQYEPAGRPGRFVGAGVSKYVVTQLAYYPVAVEYRHGVARAAACCRVRIAAATRSDSCRRTRRSVTYDTET